MVKLYVEEPSSADVADWTASAEVFATSLAACAEARAAFARRYRERAFSAIDYKKLISLFDVEMKNLMTILLTGKLVQRAGDYAEKHGLRGFDAIHLASALMLCEKLASPVTFSCYDNRLQAASQAEKLDHPRNLLKTNTFARFQLQTQN